MYQPDNAGVAELESLEAALQVPRVGELGEAGEDGGIRRTAALVQQVNLVGIVAGNSLKLVVFNRKFQLKWRL